MERVENSLHISHFYALSTSLVETADVYVGKKDIVTKEKTANIIINSNLWNAMVDAQADPMLAVTLSDIYAWSIDFYGIAKGDSDRTQYAQRQQQWKTPIGTGTGKTEKNILKVCMKRLIDKLRHYHSLTGEEYANLLSCQDTGTLLYLQQQAREVTLAHFGNGIFIRGLIEVSNRCRNNCHYCGIRKGNTAITRYALKRETILECCREGYALGFRTFVMQGGEDPALTDEWIEKTVAAIHCEFPDCAITLSLGEKSREAYERFFRAGANRYLLRHETHNEEHYRKLHPEEMSLKHRLQCLQWLKEIGYQTGTGIMVGTPGQTLTHLVEDLLFIEQFQPQMIGIGPFIPHHDTPFGTEPAGSVGMTLKLLSLFRLMHPSALIPSTTALATLSPDGREKGILAGANVVMPNLSPREQREKYTLYDNKAAFGAEAAEGLRALAQQLETIGYRISTDRGDYH